MHATKLVVLGKPARKVVLVKCQGLNIKQNELSYGKVLNKTIKRGNLLG